MSERESNVDSGLPYGLKVCGVLLIVAQVALPPMWASIQAGSLLGMLISLLLADLIGKIVWRLC